MQKQLVYALPNAYNNGMKLEKLSENQIRCTLTKDDLLERQIKLSELAYGSEKTRALFRDMMQIASKELGFEADDTPLMIEAIPLPSECIILLITKVEDPEELDTRFAKFAPGGEAVPDAGASSGASLPEGADNVLDMFRKLLERRSGENTSGTAAASSDGTLDMTRIYYFPDLDTVIQAARVLKGSYYGFNTLYHMTDAGDYCLLVKKSGHTPEEFNKFSNILSEYADNDKYTPAGEAYLNEHEDVIVSQNALQRLALL